MATIMEKDVLIEKIANLTAKIGLAQEDNSVNPDLEWLKKSRTMLLCTPAEDIQFEAWVSILNSIRQAYKLTK